MHISQRSTRERILNTAFKLWESPQGVYLSHTETSVGGLLALHLALRQDTRSDILLESRSAYGSLYASEMPAGIVRAMSWKQSEVSPEDTDSPLIIPAKFSLVPLDQLRQWIALCEGIKVAVQGYSHEKMELPIYTIRIETDLRSCVFQKIWQFGNEENHDLEQIWHILWTALQFHLQTSDPLLQIEEIFPHTQPDHYSYDLQRYQAAEDLSKDLLSGY